MRIAIAFLVVMLSLQAEDAVKPPKPPPDMFAETTTKPAVAEKKSARPAAKEEPEKSEEDKIRDKWKERGFTPLKNLAFAFKDFKVVSNTIGYVTFVGQMANVDRDFKIGAQFTLNAYDEKNELLNTDSFYIMNFDQGVKAFKAMMKVDLKKIKKYDIQFETGH